MCRSSDAAEDAAANGAVARQPLESEEERADLIEHGLGAPEKPRELFMGLDKQVLQAAAVVTAFPSVSRRQRQESYPAT